MTIDVKENREIRRYIPILAWLPQYKRAVVDPDADHIQRRIRKFAKHWLPE